MKKLVEISEEGFEKLLGERITLFCCRYIYTGKLIGVNDDSVMLADCGIVYDTGELTTTEWSDYQKLPNDWYVSLASVESYGILK